jgi:hypothetical protein
MKKLPNVVSALILIALMVLIGYVVPITLVLSNSEISNPEYSFSLNLFQGILFAGIFGIMVLYFARYLIKKDDKYGNSFGFFNIGEKPALSIFSRFTPLQLTILFGILFSVIFLSANLLSLKGFTSAKVLPQQFSPGESLVFSTLLIPTAEESLSMFVTALLVLALVVIAIKNKMPSGEFNTFYFGLIPAIMGAIAVFWHLSAYQGSDISLIIVFMFWAVKTLLVLVTGFFVVGWLFHTFNNFFIDFSRLAISSDTVLWTIIGIIVVLVGLYALLYGGRIFGSSKKPEEVL